MFFNWSVYFSVYFFLVIAVNYLCRWRFNLAKVKVLKSNEILKDENNTMKTISTLWAYAKHLTVKSKRKYIKYAWFNMMLPCIYIFKMFIHITKIETNSVYDCLFQ